MRSNVSPLTCLNPVPGVVYWIVANPANWISFHSFSQVDKNRRLGIKCWFKCEPAQIRKSCRTAVVEAAFISLTWSKIKRKIKAKCYNDQAPLFSCLWKTFFAIQRLAFLLPDWITSAYLLPPAPP